MNPLLFFWLFFKASLLSFGGLGNLPFLQNDLTALGWAQSSDFINAIAVGQISPGPTGLWSISLGYLIYGWTGAGLALAGLSMLPLLVLLLASFYYRIQRAQAVQNFTRGLALAVVGLTLSVAWSLARSAIIDWRAAAITLAALGLALSRRIPVVVILGLAAAAGLLIYAH